MNKKEFVDLVAESYGGQKSMASDAVEAVLSAVSKGLGSGERIQITGFGTFEVRHRPARVGRNPRTGAPVQIAASNAPAFKAGKGLKDAVN